MPQNSLAFVMNGQKQSAQGPSLCFYSHRFTFSNRLSRRRTWFKWPKRFLPDCEGANGSKPWSDPGDDSASDIFWAVPVRVVSNIFFTGTKGEDSQFDAYFSNGWNHQLVIVHCPLFREPLGHDAIPCYSLVLRLFCAAHDLAVETNTITFNVYLSVAQLQIGSPNKVDTVFDSILYFHILLLQIFTLAVVRHVLCMLRFNVSRGLSQALASCGWVEALNSLAKESINSVDLISLLAEVGWLTIRDGCPEQSLHIDLEIHWFFWAIHP